jgi:hypothetical protein
MVLYSYVLFVLLLVGRCRHLVVDNCYELTSRVVICNSVVKLAGQFVWGQKKEVEVILEWKLREHILPNISTTRSGCHRVITSSFDGWQFVCHSAPSAHFSALNNSRRDGRRI